ncbi:MAG TPA: alpha/beta hydrolase [Gemmatimonadales bacterium]|nr:alpha/beta hydrolase [Gemmatimonadales bacterium]
MTRPEQPSAGTVVSADGLALHYEIHGAGDPTLVLPLACWTLPDLAQTLPGFRIVGYDPRGRGQSAPVAADTAIGIEADVADLERLRTAVGLERMVLVGWSYLGGVVARYALAHPDRVSALVLLGPLPIRRIPHFGQGARAVSERIDAEAMAAVGRDARAGLHTSDPEKFCRAWYRALEPAYAATPGVLERMRAEPCRYPNEHPATVNTLLGRIWQGMGDWDWRKDFGAGTVPTLVLQGDADFQPRAVAEEWGELPNARVVILEGAGHLAWLDRPDAVRNAIRAFLAAPLSVGGW